MFEARIIRLERDVRLLRTYAILVSALVGFLALSAFRKSQGPEVLRVRGLIVEDSLGRERVLIGAPIPPAKNRVRTDMARVAAIWGPHFPAAYVKEYYPQYRHDMNGILVLDANGFDRVALGQDVPDPNIGKRIGRSTGIVVNDTLGFERSGYGLLTVNGKDRVVIGLDNDAGEALSLVVDDAGRVGVTVRDGNRALELGKGSVAEPAAGATKPFFGLMLRDGQRVSHLIATDTLR